MPPAPSSSNLLAEAFSEFVSASARLELSYRDLQAEVAELSHSLAERNQALGESLSENRDMQLALRQVLHSMPCGVLVVNKEGTLQLVNAEAARLLDLPIDEPDAPIHLDTVLGGIGKDLFCTIVSDAALGNQAREQEFSFDLPDAEGRPTERHWVLISKVRLPEKPGGRAGGPANGEVVLTLRDISARKRMEAEREAAREAVALAQVSALLAHEIRNPLASLELFAGLIADNPERTGEWLSHLRAGIRGLSGTVNNVLLLHGGGNPRLERLELSEEATTAVEFLQPVARQHSVVLGLDFVDQEQLWLHANKSALHQLLINLCSNALRHTPPGGSVQLRCGAQGSKRKRTVRVSVIDTGAGIAEEHLSHLFESGFSGSGTTPGLGLAVCDRLMRQHGGSIHVASRLGHGSTFTLEFPEAPPA